MGMLAALPVVAAAANNSAGNALHISWGDRRVSPGQNFFEYADGGWRKTHPVPPDRSSWGTFDIVQLKNQKAILDILEKAAETHGETGSTTQKVGDFYASGMDAALIDREGIKPLEPELRGIAAVRTLAQLEQEVALLQMIGVDAMFDIREMQDFANSSKVIGAAFQGGLGLPDRNYYLNPGPKFKQIRAEYVEHLARTFELLGDGETHSAVEAATVMRIETGLATASMSRAEERNPRAIYHVMDLTQLDQLMPTFSWKAYFAAIGYPHITSIDLAMPKFFNFLGRDLARVSLADWKTYLRWRLIDAFAPYLSKPFVDEDFRMQSILTGTKVLRPRWQRVVVAEDNAIGFAVGKLYVRKKFPPSRKRAVLSILRNIRGALRGDLETLSWMTPATRKAALQKLALMGEHIGYPDKWRDYSDLTINRGPYVLNVLRANEFEVKRELNKIGRPVDRDEWSMTPQTVNAYYDSSMNEINLPAGILQAPFFDPRASAAMNYGALGFVMGHEMTHGFDDEGSQFDGYGNLKRWWMPQDEKRFSAATACIEKHFSRYTVDGGLHVQGRLVVGEATADLGGLTLAWRAFHASTAYQKATTIDGLTPDQQFFLGAAHVWATNTRSAEARRLVTVDPHPPAEYRVNGTLANMPQFQKAFHLTRRSPMVNRHRCVIW